MKWIGQHIIDSTSRLRGDIYFPNLESSSETRTLVVDANGKITVNLDIAGDITSVIAGNGLSGGGTAGDVTLHIDLSEYSSVTPATGDSLATLDRDNATEQLTTVDDLATLYAGTGLTAASAVLSVDASQTQITAIGTIATGVWEGTAIASAYLDADTAHLSGTQTFSGAKTFSANTTISGILILDGDKNAGEAGALHVDASTITDTVTSGSGTVAKYRTVGIEAYTLAATNSSVTYTDAASLYIGAVPQAGTNITIANQWALWVDAGAARFDGGITFPSNANTADYCNIATTTNGATTITTVDADAALAHFEIAADGNIILDAADDISLEVAGGNISGDAALYNFTNTSSSNPVMQIINNANDDTGPYLKLVNNRGGNNGAGNDQLGYISFVGNDDAGNAQQYAQIWTLIDVAANGEESGKLLFNVQAHNGTSTTGLEMVGGSEAGEVDVVIAKGTNSLTSISGDLGIAGDTITANGALEIATGGSGDIVLDSAADITLECGGGSFSCDADNVYFISANADDPQIVIKNTTDDNQAARLAFIKDRGAAMADSDRIAEIDFFGEDASQNTQQYAKIMVQALESDHGSETGMMTLKVAEYDGTMGTGLYLGGGTADGVIDATIGLGAASTTTVAGNLDLGGHLKKRLHYVHCDIKDTGSDMTDEYYLSLGDAEREATNPLNVAIPIIMPATGVLKRVIKRSQSDLSAKAWSYKVKRVPSGTALGGFDLIATVTKNAGGAANTNSVIDFTTDASDAANACTFASGFSTSTQFNAGDSILFSYQCTSGSGPSGTPKIIWTLVFELDDSTAL